MSPRALVLSILPAVVIGATPALAQQSPAAACPMTYVKFETAIAHVDLDVCPAELAGKDRFCRASTANDRLHVYAFELEGAQCLVGMQSYESDRFSLAVKAPK